MRKVDYYISKQNLSSLSVGHFKLTFKKTSKFLVVRFKFVKHLITQSSYTLIIRDAFRDLILFLQYCIKGTKFFTKCRCWRFTLLKADCGCSADGCGVDIDPQPARSRPKTRRSRPRHPAPFKPCWLDGQLPFKCPGCLVILLLPKKCL